MSFQIESGKRITEYRLEEKIGEGGYGEVWKATHHLFDDQQVAIKFPSDPAFIQSLRKEGTVQHELDHPGIVQTRGLDPWHKPPYLIMEYVPGDSLRTWLERIGSFSLNATLHITRQILETLAFAHDQGVIHGDMKPANVFLLSGNQDSDPSVHRHLRPENARVRIGDFGLARHTSIPDQNGSLENSGFLQEENERVIGGTYDYLAPETRAGESGLSTGDDIYATGVLFYELLTGRKPEGTFSYPSRIDPSYSEKLDTFLRTCIHPDPHQRFHRCQLALQFLDDLEKDRNKSGNEPSSASGSGVPTGAKPGESEDRDDIPSAGTPSAPFTFENGTTVRTLPEFVDACDRHREMALHHLASGDLTRWLRDIGEHQLADRSAELSEKNQLDVTDVEQFLQETKLVPPPRPELDVYRIDAGAVPPGNRVTDVVHITNYGRGVLEGEIRAEDHVKWLTWNPGTFQGDDVAVGIEMTADAGMEPGTTYTNKLIFDTTGGTLTLPVRFQVGETDECIWPRDREIILFDASHSGSATTVIDNPGDTASSYNLESESDWIHINEGEGFLKPGESLPLEVDIRKQRISDKDWERSPFLENNGGTGLKEVSGQIRIRGETDSKTDGGSNPNRKEKYRQNEINVRVVRLTSPHLWKGIGACFVGGLYGLNQWVNSPWLSDLGHIAIGLMTLAVILLFGFRMTGILRVPRSTRHSGTPGRGKQDVNPPVRNYQFLQRLWNLSLGALLTYAILLLF